MPLPHAMAQKQQIAPIFRWAGSKRKLLPRLLPYWELSGGRYVEPFLGSGALFFAARPEKAVLADINSELILTYQTVRNQPDEVAATLAATPRNKSTYDALREVSPEQLPDVDRAARFIFLNRHCFNGLYRTNAQGRFNVPYAPTKTGSVPGRNHLRHVAAQLRRARLLHGDFEAVIRRVLQPGDFVYLDPPFAVGNRRLFRQYSATSFGFADLDRLASLLYVIDAIGASFVLSYAVCSESIAAFGDWRTQRVLTTRNIAGFASNRRRAAELMVTNIAC